MSSIVTSDLIPLKQRGVYQGFGNIVFAGGAAIGGPLGGLLGDTIGWKWAFLIQFVPISHRRTFAQICLLQNPSVCPPFWHRSLEGRHSIRPWRHYDKAEAH